ncbi:MAG: TetR/AcrR family transcriptional regulator [Spirochaetales bacterium]|nr:TetR/AcrR family transcriptional regulator [Spirochaetales bacterium]
MREGLENFFKIKEEKQSKIINSALEEFSKKGFAQGNTNEICKNAGISKGLLFHYFGNKKNLYLYLVDITTKEMYKRMMEYMPKSQLDMFDLIVEISMIKLRIGLEMAEGYKLIYEAYINTPKEIESEIDMHMKEAFAAQRETFDKLVDDSKFKPEISKKRAIDIIFSCSKGMYDQYIEYYKTITPEEALANIEEVKEDMLETFGILKKAFYKEEFL